MRKTIGRKSAPSVETFVCPECGKAFKTRGALGGHRAYIHKGNSAASPSDPQPGQVVCPECGKAFKNRGALGGHMAYLHKGAKKAEQPATKAIQPAHRSPSRPTLATPSGTPALVHAGAANPSPGTAHKHLRAAHEALVARDQHIEGELKRLAELQTEKEQVRRELDAVKTALQVFGDT